MLIFMRDWMKTMNKYNNYQDYRQFITILKFTSLIKLTINE